MRRVGLKEIDPIHFPWISPRVMARRVHGYTYAYMVCDVRADALHIQQGMDERAGKQPSAANDWDDV